MGRKFSLGATVSLAAITAAITVSLTYVYAMNHFNAKMADVNQRQAMYNKLSEIDQKARQDFIGRIDETQLKDGIGTGYMAGLGDPNGRYLSAEKYKTYLAGNSGKNVGVGILTIQDSDGNMEVIEVFPNSAAERSGVKKGDVITAVDGKEIVRISYGEALNYLDGTAGSTVMLTILRNTTAEDGTESAERLELTATRSEYQRSLVKSTIINGNVGYMAVSDFQEATVEQFGSALQSLRNKGVCGLVIDLRSNSGGSVEPMAEILDQLLPAGNTVSSVDNEGKTTVEFTSDADELPLPVSVIVNGETYGAAEIFAADIKDYKKGLLVGETTAGYGVKEQVLPLTDGSAIVLSVGNYTRVNGETFGGAGIQPDIEMALSSAQEELFKRKSLPEADDPQLQAAVTALLRQGAGVLEIPGTGVSSSQPAEGESAGSGSSGESPDPASSEAQPSENPAASSEAPVSAASAQG